MIRGSKPIVAIALLASVAALPVGAQQATPAATDKQSAPIEIKVELDDFSVTPDRTALVAGQAYRFVVKNGGAATHEFVIEPGDVVDEPLESGKGEAELEDIGPGETKELTWTFAEAGDYQMACHVPGHFEAGMKAAFSVVPRETDTVKVEIGDFFLKPATTTLKADTSYLFEVTNNGEATHEFVLEAEGKVDEPLEMEETSGDDPEAEIEDIAPGQTKTLVWRFADPGAYQMACHVPGHYEAGMKTPFDVKP